MCMTAKLGDIMVVNDCLLWKGVATSGCDKTILYPVRPSSDAI